MANPVGWTKSGNSLPATISTVLVESYGNRIYAFAGNTSSTPTFNLNIYSSQFEEGSLRGWQTAVHTLPVAAENAALARKGNFLYVIGGTSADETTATQNVQIGTIQVNGEITWVNSKSAVLPTALFLNRGATWDNFLFVVGGNTAGDSGSVIYSKINSDGSLTPWVTGIALPSPLAAGGWQNGILFARQGYLYFGAGAEVTGNTVQTVMWSSKINSDGSLAAWKQVGGVMSSAHFKPGWAVVGNNLVIVAGSTSSSRANVTNVVESAQLMPDGGLGAFSATTAYPISAWGMAGVGVGDYMFMMGGVNNTPTYYSDVYSAKVQSNGVI
ncbi:MAG: hypothetical protein KGO96_07200 [Elusimicrobia bacterium]|nr:hypothetical protein [Elusimicrobiota bacterium]